MLLVTKTNFPTEEVFFGVPRDAPGAIFTSIAVRGRATLFATFSGVQIGFTQKPGQRTLTEVFKPFDGAEFVWIGQSILLSNIAEQCMYISETLNV